VWNCEDELVFSQKPFERICPASTTKIMTVLIACERSQLPVDNIKRVPLTSEYVVPDWIR
jgi:D-alanyl-D-alanine carboxypeptidase